MILKITVKPSLALSRKSYVHRGGWVETTTTFNVNTGATDMIGALSSHERELIFAQFVNDDATADSLPRSHTQVWLTVDSWPTGHESALRMWLDANA